MSSRSIILLLGTALCGAPVLAYADPDFHVLATFGGQNGSGPEAALSFDHDGNLYGTTIGSVVGLGGYTGFVPSSGHGTVFELSGYNHRRMTTLIAFDGVNGQQPVGGVTFDKAGNVFGETLSGGPQGPNGYGNIYELSGPGHRTFTDLHDFPMAEAVSDAGLTFVAAGQPFVPDQPYLSGDLLGSGYVTDLSGNGFLFKLAGPDHKTFVHAVELGTSDPAGSDYFGSITADGFGNLFIGKNEYAGGNQVSTSIGELSGPGHKTYTTLATFDPATTGLGVSSPMVYDRYGNLYGVTSAGGPLNGGTVFELSGPGHRRLTALAAFDPDFTSGRPSLPAGPLLVDYAGNVFGVTTSGGDLEYYPGTNEISGTGGLIYKISADHKTFTVLHRFDCAVDGCAPRAGLVADRAGNLYGTNASYGYGGSVFKLSNAGFVPFRQ